MKKKMILLLSTMIILVAIGILISMISNKETKSSVNQEDSKIKIVTTFYPMYLIGLNIFDQIDTVEVTSLTDTDTGCLHDYQLTTEDMKNIATADVIVINGGGMESFLDNVIINYPNLKVIDASRGIEMLPNEEWEIHEEEEEESEFNSHVWLDPKLYIKQIENVREGLIDYFNQSLSAPEELELAIEKNTQTYINKVKELDAEIENNLKIDVASKQQAGISNQVIIFHNSFAYLANRIGLTVAHTVPLDSDTALSAAQIAEIIDAVREDQIKYLFTEQQYGDSIANRIEAETDTSVYIIDSVVTGDGSKDSYLSAMQNNLLILKEALQ